MPVRRSAAAWLVPFAAALSLLSFSAATAQIPEPPSTIGGSVTDADGDVPAGVPVEAVVNNKVCGTSETVYAGEGDERVTAYVVDVVSHRQTEGCGSSGDAVRIRIGDRLSPSAVEWEQGFVEFDIVFGDTEPDVIPTFTPTPEGQRSTPTPRQQTEATPTPGSGGSGGDGSGGQGGNGDASSSQDDGEGSEDGDEDTTPSPTGENGEDGTQTGTPEDGDDGTATATDSTPAPASAGSGDGDGGFPVWATILLVIGGVAAVGGGVGYYMARSGGSGSATESDDIIGS